MSNNPESGAVVLVSGGIDSSVLLHHVARNLHHTPVHVLSFNYGQRHSKEIECARWQANSVDAEAHRIIDISFLGGLVRGASALIAGGRAVPAFTKLAEEELDQPPTYVPNRNMILLSIGGAYAEAHRIRNVFYGAQALDEYGYWDCTPDFLERVNAVLSLNRRERVTIHAPFIEKKKSDSIRLGQELGVLFAQTWSCYRGETKACGVCPTCVERLKAFKEVGVEDPIPYET